MRSLIKKVLLREFGELVTDYDEWLESIYDWDINPMFEYSSNEMVAYDSNENYLGYWNTEENTGLVVTELIDRSYE
jgi:hypothetical protein